MSRDTFAPTRSDGTSADLVPLRALNEYVYCPRLHHLVYVQGIFVESADTVQGSAQHARAQAKTSRGVQKKRGGAPEPEDGDGPPWASPPCELYLGSEELGLVGKLDALRQEHGIAVPVESKRGSPPAWDQPFFVEGIELPPDAWPGDQVQVAAQVLLLRANGYESSYGILYYRLSRRTVLVRLTPELEEVVRLITSRARAAAEGPMPAPLVSSPKCPRCSLVGICLPEETNSFLEAIEEPRRILPARHDGGCLYLVSPGMRVGVSGEALTITPREGPTQRVLLKDVVSVMVMGSVQITTQALHALMKTGRQVTYTTGSGRLVGVAGGLGTKNVMLRQLQVQTSEDRLRSLRIARSIVVAKVANQRTLVRRNGTPGGELLLEMKRRRDAAARAGDINCLRGEEGRAARLYFEAFAGLLPKDPEMGWSMDGRNRRPPKDPVNALLSFGYALLAKDTMTACVAVGFDPMVGFLHQLRPGRPALVLDLMEAFRPLVVDSTVLRAIKTRAVTSESFVRSQAGVLLSRAGRKAFIGAYEHRMEELVTHPSFDYRMSYRRILELEARLLARHLEGELPEYRPLTTR